MKINYEWLSTYFDNEVLPEPHALADLLTFHAYEVEGIEEVSGTTVLDVDVLPNRSSDSLSHRGVAREVATLLNVSLKEDPLREQAMLTPVAETVSVTLAPDASCTRYVAGYIIGVKVGPSPDWLRERLEAVGQKSINNVVDATNYVLFGLGQPTHVFDAQKLSGKDTHIGTRRAKSGEQVTLLGGESAELAESMTVIVDQNSDTPLAVAGVKGGTHAEVDDTTVDVIIESAKFDALQTRLTAQALKIRTDASTRYENDVPDQLSDYGAQLVAHIILETGGGTLQGFAVAGEYTHENSEVAFSVEDTNTLLGLSLTGDEIAVILDRLGFSHTRDDDAFVTVAPFERTDITIKEDVIEEIGRVYGYENVPTLPLTNEQQKSQVNKRYAYAERIRQALTAAGFSEMYLYSLRATGDVLLVNALASDKNHLRGNLADGLREALDKNEYNAPLAGEYDAVRVFEVGNVFTGDAEEFHIAVAARPLSNKKREAKTQAILEEAKQLLEDVLGVAVGASIEDEILEVNLTDVTDSLPDTTYPTRDYIAQRVTYSPLSQYPFMLRDIAAWMPADTSAADVEAVIREHGTELLQRVDQFDEFTKDDKTSRAFHLVFQAHDRTLTDKEVNDIMQNITNAFTQKGWEVR